MTDDARVDSTLTCLQPDGSGSWENNFLETMSSDKGPRGGASMTVEGKMFGLTFHEEWYASALCMIPYHWRSVLLLLVMRRRTIEASACTSTLVSVTDGAL